MIEKYKAMNVLRVQLGYKQWMDNWVIWDFKEQVYIGYCPDEDEIYRHAEPTAFLLGWGEAREEWGKQQ